ncbi:DNA ligase, partial [Candidatus Woesearchaeota archaeon]|nr:DNA ligase [Candidatus Woesearchaeota archaeon]
MLKAIHTAAGISVDEVEERWKKLGDLGDVAEALMSGKKQVTLFSSTLSVKKVVSNLQKLSGLEGEGTVERKVQLVAELLTSASPSEAKYLIRTILEELRVGVAEGIMRDAIVWAFFGDV